jgi:CRISPR-associated protein Cas2
MGLERRDILTVMIYDVAEDGRRNRLFALLKQYGTAVQKSAFEGRLSVTERERLVKRAGELIDPATDRFIMYTVAAPQERNIVCIGQPRPTIISETYYIV